MRVRAGLDVVHKVQRIVDEAMAEAVAQAGAEQIGDEVGEADENGVHGVEQRGDEQEGELQRLGDPGQERGQRRRAHDPATRAWFSGLALR